MKKIIALCLIVLGMPNAFSQDTIIEENEVDEIIDKILMEDQDIDLFIESTTDFQLIYLSLNYNNDTYFSGRDIGIDQFNIRPQVTYMHSKGFFASISGVYYSEFTPNWDYAVTSLGYDTYLDKKKAIRLNSSYSRYFYAEGVKNPFTNAVSVGLGIKNIKRTLGSQLTGTFLFGDDTSLQLVSRSFVAFNLLRTNKFNLKFSPEINFVVAQQTLELAQTSFQNGILVTNYLENDVFDLINTQLSFPLQFRSNSYDLEVGYNLNFPSALGNESDLNTTGFFNLSIGYMIDF